MPRFPSWFVALPLSIAPCLPGQLPTDDPSRVWQTVQEYFSHDQPGQPLAFIEGTRRVNSFVHYTHLGTDFGFHGPAAFEISWRQNILRANLRQQPDAWAGMWHCLAGLAREPARTLDFAAPFPPWINPSQQPKVDAVQVIASGFGTLKLEIQDPDQTAIWTHLLNLRDSAFQTITLPLPSNDLRRGKFLNWTAEPGSDISINRLSLGFKMPRMEPDHYAFLTSYAKLARCYEGGIGLVRDRAHTEPGAFDTVPSSGLFVLATAAAASPHLAIVSPAQARDILEKIHAQVSALQSPSGLLPHFIRHDGAAYHVHPGTEYSTIDTAIYYHSMLLAARMLDLPDIETTLLHRIASIQFDDLLLPDGSISHGLQSDAKSLLPHGWQDWGGETALVLLLHRLANPASRPLNKVDHPGEPWLGTGFITEIQSLFYPDFDSDEPDALNGLSWGPVRRRHLNQQQHYINRRWRGTLADEIGLYGLSAGENASGSAYLVSGIQLRGQDLIHPHYFLMSSRLRHSIPEVLDVIVSLRRIGFFPPYGLVENVTVTGNSYLPMNGSLNAGFEALSAFHLLCQHRSLPNAVFDAARSSPHLQRALRLYFPRDAAE
jgi:hypothetical protein